MLARKSAESEEGENPFIHFVQVSLYFCKVSIFGFYYEGRCYYVIVHMVDYFNGFYKCTQSIDFLYLTDISDFYSAQKLWTVDVKSHFY